MPIQNDKQRLSVIADEPISVTVDATDLSFASAEPLRNIIDRFGRPVVARAFADFQQPGLAELSVQLYQMGFTLVHCPSWPNGDGFAKSIVSDVMAQDLRDQLEELEEVETYLVVATSREYIAVANALKRHDRRVVVVAEDAKVCRELKLCADEFALMPAIRAVRPSRISEASRLERLAEVRPEVRAERPEREAPRIERHVEAVRPEPVRPEPVKAEPVRAEAVKAERVEPQDSVRLPNDAEVIAEVKRIVSAEGICTPRRLGRALCPVDRTPTGELRSRIANRIQSLIDAGKLQRERLVVGGTSVETILVREEKSGNGRAASTAGRAEAPPAAAIFGQSVQSFEAVPSVEDEGEDGLAAVAEAVEAQVEQETEAPAVPASSLLEVSPTELPTLAKDLDALVESVLRSPDLAAGLMHREPEPTPEPETPLALPEPAQPAPEPPKRSRSRRRTPSKASAAEAEKATVPDAGGTA